MTEIINQTLPNESHDKHNADLSMVVFEKRIYQDGTKYLKCADNLFFEGLYEATNHNLVIADKLLDFTNCTFSAGGAAAIFNGDNLHIVNSELKAKEAIFILSPAIFSHNSKVIAPDIYAYEGTIVSAEPNTFEGNLHLVHSFEELKPTMDHYLLG